MAKTRVAEQFDLFATPESRDGTAVQAPAWVRHPDMVEQVRGELLATLEGLRAAREFPFRNGTAAMSAEIRFNDLAEIWLPPEEGHPLQLAFAAEMARLGEAADYPIYDWIGRHRPPPG